MGVMQVATSCFNALGRPLPPVAISVTRAFGCYIPLSILGNHLWGFVGVFIGMAATNVLTGIVSWYWSRHTVRRGIARALET